MPEQPQPAPQEQPPVEVPRPVYQAVLQTLGQLPWEKVAPIMAELIKAGQK